MSDFNPIENRNFLSPTGFKFTLDKTPGVAFFCNQANIPSLDLGIAVQPSYLKDIDRPGDKLVFGDLSIRFLVDEDLKNYMIIHNWMTGLGFPESFQQFKDLTTDEEGQDDRKLQYCDGTLHILNSNYRDTAMVKFKDLFPTSLTSLDFTASDNDVNYFTAEVTFKYTIYNILDPNGNAL